MSETKSILVVDDDKNICDLIKLYLSNEGYNVVLTHDGSDALSILRDQKFDLVLLDLMLPTINGWETCKMIKKNWSVPIIIVSSRDLVDDKVQVFENGADDYVVKPFEPKELIARVKARLRSPVEDSENKNNVVKIGNTTIDLNKYEVTINGEAIELKPKEVQLLYFLIKNKNIVLTRDVLLEKVWDYEVSVSTRTVDVHVKNLREKIENSDVNIKTIWGVGYKVEAK